MISRRTCGWRNGMVGSFVGWAKSRAKAVPRAMTESAILPTRSCFARGRTAWVKSPNRRTNCQRVARRFCPPYAAVLVPILALISQPVVAEPVDEFYQGKVITLTVASSAGGEYD